MACSHPRSSGAAAGDPGGAMSRRACGHLDNCRTAIVSVPLDMLAAFRRSFMLCLGMKSSPLLSSRHTPQRRCGSATRCGLQVLTRGRVAGRHRLWLSDLQLTYQALCGRGPAVSVTEPSSQGLFVTAIPGKEVHCGQTVSRCGRAIGHAHVLDDDCPVRCPEGMHGQVDGYRSRGEEPSAGARPALTGHEEGRYPSARSPEPTPGRGPHPGERPIGNVGR
jgi:hypothetical protein